jgi:hypothetical protein
VQNPLTGYGNSTADRCCSVDRAGSRANSAPVPSIEFVVKRGEERVASFTTDAAGRFRVSLPPGHFVVLREDPGARVDPWQYETDVAAGRFTQVNWTADTGMR